MSDGPTELDRLLRQETALPPRPGRVRVRVDVVASAPGEVLARVREVIAVVLGQREHWLDRDAWSSILPPWFVAACAPEVTREEALRQERALLGLPRDEAATRIAGEAWSLSNWLYWMHPAERPWSWSSATVRPDGIDVELDVDDLPVPLGAFEWIFRAAGARSISTDLP